MEFNELMNMVTTWWPFIVTVLVVILLVSVWLAEGSRRTIRKEDSEYKFFKKHGYWPGEEEE